MMGLRVKKNEDESAQRWSLSIQYCIVNERVSLEIIDTDVKFSNVDGGVAAAQERNYWWTKIRIGNFLETISFPWFERSFFEWCELRLCNAE